MNDLGRDVVLSELNLLENKIFPAEFFRRKRTNPAVKGRYEYHNLVRGIYKPTGCDMAISILQVLAGPYADALRYDDDSNWLLEYIQQGRGSTSWDNLSLERCIGGAPVAVIIQQSSKTSRQGSRYKILGLGKVESYEKDAGIFKVTRWRGDTRTGRVKATERDISAQEKAIEGFLSKPFRPFEDSRQPTLVKRPAREEAFRRRLIALYDGKCVACGSRWVVDGKHESQAAHIIPKSRNGSDDPRNGITLCRFHHWAFDRGLFSLNDDYTIVVSSQVSKFSNRPETMKTIAGTKALPPAKKEAHPDPQALEWHRRSVFIN